MPVYRLGRGCLLALLSLIILGSSSSAFAGVVRLEDLESRMLGSHPAVRALDMAVRRAELEVQQARAGLSPKLDLVLYGSKAQEAPKGKVYDFDNVPIGIAITGYEETYRASVALTHLLYSGGTVTSQVRAAQAGLEAAKADRDRGVEGLLYRLRASYLALVRAKGKAQVAQRVVELSEAYLTRVQAFFRVGMVPKAEVLRAQVALSNARLNLMRAEGAVQRAYAALDRAAGFPVPRDGEMEQPASLLPEELPQDLPDLAAESRAEIRSLEESYRQAKALADAAAGQDRPQLLFKGEAYRVGSHFFPSDKDDYLLSLTLQWRSWDGGENRAKARQSLALAESLLSRVEDMKLEIRRETVEALESLREARERVKTAEVMVEQATEDHRISLRRYEARVGTNLDVMDARVRLEQAMNDLVDARCDLLSSQAALRYALGEDGWGQIAATGKPVSKGN
ncbi:LOW QUALITY PROTEIN: outer membrane protein [Thermanaerovibrio velox DSM 12556]|uniref:Outer membrane protein n=2 Tax=Thermanaerovibrio TaxID=81461 RepID=H0UNT2_9BACT|nr:LOW QUALITY PROTEIN: outer membrane protein [Thermanaerovibrio velox DSM 12556]